MNRAAPFPLESAESGVLFVTLFVIVVVPLIAWFLYRR